MRYGRERRHHGQDRAGLPPIMIAPGCLQNADAGAGREGSGAGADAAPAARDVAETLLMLYRILLLVILRSPAPRHSRRAGAVVDFPLRTARR